MMMQATRSGSGLGVGLGQGSGHGSSGGFSLVEMLVVIVIFFILMGFGVITYESMKVDNALNASAMELASTFREARGLAMRHQKHYTVAFSAIKEDWSGEGGANWDRIGEATEYDNRRLRHAVYPDNADVERPAGVEFQKAFRSDNENGTDHWYAIYKPVKYGSVSPHRDGWYANDVIPDIYRPVQWWHLYGNNGIPTNQDTSVNRDTSVKNDKKFDERKYDPHRLQVGQRRFLQRGVRFWRYYPYGEDDVDGDVHFVEGGGDLTDYFSVRRDEDRLFEYTDKGSQSYFSSADGNNGNQIRMAMLMGPTTIRTLRVPRDDGGVIPRVDSLVAFPDGTFGNPYGYGNGVITGDPHARRSANFISHAEYSARGSLSQGGSGHVSYGARRRFVIGLVWREDRTRQRSVQINHTNGEIRIRRSWNPDVD